MTEVRHQSSHTVGSLSREAQKTGKSTERESRLVVPGLGEESAFGITDVLWDDDNRVAVMVTQHCYQMPPKCHCKPVRMVCFTYILL